MESEHRQVLAHWAAVVVALPVVLVALIVGTVVLLDDGEEPSLSRWGASAFSATTAPEQPPPRAPVDAVGPPPVPPVTMTPVPPSEPLTTLPSPSSSTSTTEVPVEPVSLVPPITSTTTVPPTTSTTTVPPTTSTTTVPPTTSTTTVPPITTTVPPTTSTTTVPPPPPQAPDQAGISMPVSVFIPKLGLTRHIVLAPQDIDQIIHLIDRCQGAVALPGLATPVYLAAHRTRCGNAGFGGVETLVVGDVLDVRYANDLTVRYRVGQISENTVGAVVFDPAHGAPVALQTSLSGTRVRIVSAWPL
jgi:hypothetical protein